MSLPVVAIVGRPNVGKSTLFNRILGEQAAIVDDAPGITRDRHAAEAEWNGRRFTLVDTGGLMPEAEEELGRSVNQQIQAAVEQADLCLLVVDGRSGAAPVDREVAELLRTSGKAAILVVNKMDNAEMAKRLIWEFYELGLGDPLPASALSGTFTGDLLDAVVEALPPEVEAPDEPDVITVAVIGKPNVGKSSFLNRLIGEERFIVSPIAGTTRDAIDTRLEHEGRTFRLVDTAGIRRHASLTQGLEYYTYLRAVRALERAQIAIVMLDATQSLSRQDLRILNLAEERRRGIVVVVNKWDVVEKDERTAAHYEAAFRSQAPSLQWAPIVTISARSGQRVLRALELAEEVWREWHKRAPTPEVNRVLHQATGRVQPPQSRGRRTSRVVRILYGLQPETAPPLFVFFANEPEAIPVHYKRYLEAALREAFGFVGVPLRIAFRAARTKRRRARAAEEPESEGAESPESAKGSS